MKWLYIYIVVLLPIKKITHVRYNKTATSIKMSSPKLNFADGQYSIELKHWPGSVIFFPINAPPGMGRFQLLNMGFLGYALELRFWVVIAIIVSLTLTITLITTLTII